VLPVFGTVVRRPTVVQSAVVQSPGNLPFRTMRYTSVWWWYSGTVLSGTVVHGPPEQYNLQCTAEFRAAQQ